MCLEVTLVALYDSSGQLVRAVDAEDPRRPHAPRFWVARGFQPPFQLYELTDVPVRIAADLVSGAYAPAEATLVAARYRRIEPLREAAA